MKILELNKEILCNSKWIVTSEQSKILQEAAFDFGFSWYASGKKVLYTDSKFLILCKYYLTDINDLECFNNQDSKYIERKFEDYFKEEIRGFEPEFTIEVKNHNGEEIKINNCVFVDYPIHSFMWAVEQMKQGKKVRRKRWKHDGYLIISNENIYHGNGNDLRMWVGIIEATDFEVYEENKFGKFKVGFKGSISFGKYNIDKKHFNDLENAIKRSREIR